MITPPGVSLPQTGTTRPTRSNFGAFKDQGIPQNGNLNVTALRHESGESFKDVGIKHGIVQEWETLLLAPKPYERHMFGTQFETNASSV